MSQTTYRLVETASGAAIKRSSDGARAYPADVARLVSLTRPDLAATGQIAAVLTADPTLSADEVIALLDDAAADHRAEQE